MARRRSMQSPKRFTRQWWTESGHNFFWVALVTALVWIYADMEFTEDEDLKATLALITSTDTDLKILSKTEFPLQFEAKANRQTLDTFSKWLRSRGEIIRYDISQNAGPGGHPISTVALLQDIARRQGSPLTIISCSPATIRVEIDRLLTKTIPVKFDYSGAELDSPAVLDPASVDIRVGEKDWANILAKSKDSGQEPALTTKQVNLSSATAGATQTPRVDLVATIADIRVEPLLKQVKATFTVKLRKRTETIEIAVGLKIPPAWCEEEDDTWNRYFLERKDPQEWAVKINVSGPVKDIQKLAAEKKTTAYVVLTEEDKKPLDTYLKRDVVVEFPPDLQVEMVGSTPQVQFRLTERAATTAPPA